MPNKKILKENVQSSPIKESILTTPEKETIRKPKELECCPKLMQQSMCETLNFRYRLPFISHVQEDNRRIPIEVVLHFRLERCSGSIVVGDPIYSTTLLPGEKVRLFTSDRHTCWSYDSESSLAYRHETTSEESFYIGAMAKALSDLTINESGTSSSDYQSSWAEGSRSSSGSIPSFLFGVGGSSKKGSYDSDSLFAFSRSLSQHAEAVSASIAAGVRAKSATSIGEVEQRTHKEGESEAHYESSSRMFHNPNKCRAVTYLFHKLNKLQTIKFKLVAIERRVDDPKTPTGVYQRIPLDTSGQVTVLPQYITATNKNRLEIERMARASVAERQTDYQNILVNTATPVANLAVTQPYYYVRADAPKFTAELAEPLVEPTFSIPVRKTAIEVVDKELEEAGILDRKTGKPNERLVAELSWEREEVLPTPGVIIRGCLDECDTCEPALQREIELDLERKQLENDLLRKQIELLEKSQEYRCCMGESAGSEEPVGE